ncbi:MAG: DEAD/DEAH box helicase family protein, partial [Bacteroidetes bacterium]|nr:DEAD/DEAH box helicase family protein [Bacteroidota bacterium]
MEVGIYEQLINKLIRDELNSLDHQEFFIREKKVDQTEATKFLSNYLKNVIQIALNTITGENKVKDQIELVNKIISLIIDELNDQDFKDDLVDIKGSLLAAVIKKTNLSQSSIDDYVDRITPYTRLSHSELFTGSNSGISLESELKKEILSSSEIKFIVSFIKWTGIRIFESELTEFTDRGGKLSIITTSYLGATDIKAVKFLSSLANTKVKVSYNTQSERLHAKAYLFLRNSGHHTGYIGSSNISKSALTNGLEWNLKITSSEVKHIIDKSHATFNTYWQDSSFELYDPTRDYERLNSALRSERYKETERKSITFFDLRPFPFQEEILDTLRLERNVHSRFRNLIVAATGTGKTVISAFDFKDYIKTFPKARLLYVSHRKEILMQAQATFQNILKNANFGELWFDGASPVNFDNIFVSVQTINNHLDNLRITKDFYDFIIVDEVHHITANSYRPILKHFNPKILLGLTATPERMDGADILADFDNKIAAEIRLPEALNRRLLCPFQYFGISDNTDLTKVAWRNGKYQVSELTELYLTDENRLRLIINSLDKYLDDMNEVRALGFCVSQKHAEFMSKRFNEAGLKADYLTSNRTENRDDIKSRLRKKEINYLFVVDIFNEGVDIPEIDTVLFLRPTESLTIFLQQLGRGLRMSEGKECLTVMDFVGNNKSEYDFEGKFRAIIG